MFAKIQKFFISELFWVYKINNLAAFAWEQIWKSTWIPFYVKRNHEHGLEAAKKNQKDYIEARKKSHPEEFEEDEEEAEAEKEAEEEDDE